MRPILLLLGVAAGVGAAAPLAATPAGWDLTEKAFNYGQGSFGEVLSYAGDRGGMQCHFEGPNSKTGLVHILWRFDPVPHPRSHGDDSWPTTLTLASGPTSAGFKALASDDPDARPPGAAIEVEANVPVRSPAMRAFGRTGVLTLTAQGITQQPTPADVALAARFIALCSS